MTTQHKVFPGHITCLVSHPLPPKLTLLEWLGIKKRPTLVAPKLYAAVGSTIFVSNEKGEFDCLLNVANK